MVLLMMLYVLPLVLLLMMCCCCCRVADASVGAAVYVEAGDGVAARAVDGVAVCDAIAAVYAAAAAVVGDAAVAAAPAAVLPRMLLLLLRFLLMLLLFVLSTADAGAVAADVAAAPASAGASGVAVWLEHPQWRGVKDAFGMQWPRTSPLNCSSVAMTWGNVGSCSGTPASGGRGTAILASRAFVKSSAAVAAPQLALGS